MPEVKRCEECGVPLLITSDRLWLNSGVIVQKSNQAQRTGFIETENLDPLYANIERIIGVPIEHLIVDVTRKGGADYARGILPPNMREMISDGKLTLEAVFSGLLRYSELMGYGKAELVELHYDIKRDTRFENHIGDYFIDRVKNPYSIIPLAGVYTGGCEVVTGSPFGVDYYEISPGLYELKFIVSEHDEELEDRLEVKAYRHRDGDIDLERCQTCNAPKGLSKFKWDEDNGFIINNWTSRRMTMVGPYVMDPLFEELEKELGDGIPSAVVESQRLFTKTGFYSIEEVTEEEDFRTQLALRGMGNVREVSMNAKGFRMRIDNAGCYLMAVGMAQGMFEIAFDVDSNVEWQVSEDGDLEVEVTPKP